MSQCPNLSKEPALSETKKYNKLIAMYFPQFHAIPENDAWWGKGFTDWDNVRVAQPQFDGHYQPRVPLNNNYYDQSEIETVRAQVELAKKFGIYGFCHYHYWFDGKQLLETPTDMMMEYAEIDFPFCLSWANETWSRRWDGRDHHILVQQNHPPTEESWRRHFNYLIKAWTDPRAIRVDNKPVFVIYRPHRIHKINQMIAFWRELAMKAGLDGLYLIAQKQYEFPNRDCLASFDAVFQFQPFESIYSPGFDGNTVRYSPMYKLVRKLPERLQDLLRGARAKFIKELTCHDYDAVWEQLIKIRNENGLTTYPGAFVDWDNTSRYKHRATIFNGASPERFKFWFEKLIASMPERNLSENLIFMNAWNEWSEGTYLEPDDRHGYQYLEAIKAVLDQKPD